MWLFVELIDNVDYITINVSAVAVLTTNTNLGRNFQLFDVNGKFTGVTGLSLTL